MNDTNKQNKFFLNRFHEIRNDMSKASLYDVTDILNHYNAGSVVNEDVTYHFQISPIEAACLNERYKTLTGKDHPVFLREQGKVLDEMIKNGEGIQVNGQPTIYQRLKNNLTGEGVGIGIIPTKKGSYIDTFEQIKFDMSHASLEEVQSILNYYDQESVLVDGGVYHFRPSVLEGETLNARYRELTGQDHPTFIEQAPKVIDGLLEDKDMLIQAGAYNADYFNQLEHMKNSIQQRQDTKTSEEKTADSNETVADNNLGVSETGAITTEDAKTVEEPKNETEATQMFMEEREKQRELDAEVRNQQIGVMEQVNQQLLTEQQAMLEMTDESSIGGMHR